MRSDLSANLDAASRGFRNRVSSGLRWAWVLLLAAGCAVDPNQCPGAPTAEPATAVPLPPGCSIVAVVDPAVAGISCIGGREGFVVMPAPPDTR